MARTLYDLGDAFNGVMDLVLDETMDLTVLEECLQAIEADITVKCENGIGLIRSLENLRDGMKAEATRLTNRQKIIDNRIRSIKDWYQRNLDAMGKSKVETMRGTMAVQNNTPALKITDEDNIPLCYLDLIPARYEVNKDAVKNALKAGEEVPGGASRAGEESQNSMNIFEKIQTVRVKLAQDGLKKGKKNEYAGYTYYELGDFLPRIMALCEECKIFPVISFTSDVATLTVYDCEKPDAKVEITTPMSTAQLKACHPVQNLGAVQTYLRRYLYIAMFEIVESDKIEAVTGKDPVAPAVPASTTESPSGRAFRCDINKPARDELVRLWQFMGWDTANIENYLATRALNMNTSQTPAFFQKVLQEQIEFCITESRKGTPGYAGRLFDDGYPFQ